MAVAVQSANIDVCNDVSSAVHHLNELAEHMKRSNEHDALEEDIQNLNAVIASIQQLAEEYVALQERFECETIEASILRYKLKMFPQQIKDEIQRAINAARQSNATEQSNLSLAWETVESNIADLERSIRQLDLEGSRLIPEREASCKLYDTTMTQLNQCMSDKAALQIVLNETRDRVRETNEDIQDLEDGIVQLREDMIKERAVARLHKKRLQKNIADTTQKLNVQQDCNATQRAEMEQVYSGMKKLSDRLQQLAESTTQLDSDRCQLEIREEYLKQKCENVLQATSETRASLDKLNADLARDTTTFVKNKAMLEDQITRLDKQIAEGKRSTQTLESQNAELLVVIKDKVKVKESDQQVIQELNSVVQAQKRELAQTSQNTAQLHAEIAEIEETLSELTQSHSVVMESLKKTADECRKVLGKERQERMELDAELEDIESALTFLQAEAKRFSDRCRKCVLDGKKTHEQLTQDGYKFQALLKECHSNVQQLQQELVVEKKQLQNMEQLSDKRVQSLQQEMVAMKKSIEDLSAAIAAQTPSFQQMELEFQERLALYESAKKNLVGLKNRKQSLEDTIRTCKRAIQQLGNSQGIRDQLKTARASSIARLHDNMAELQQLEKNIYTVDTKLSMLDDENCKFVTSIAKLENDLECVAEQKQANSDLMEQLARELDEIRRQLVKEWMNDDEIQRLVTLRDQATVRRLDEMRQETDDRQTTVTSVTDRMQSQLALLADFLDQVASRRPVDSSIPSAMTSHPDSSIPPPSSSQSQLRDKHF